MKRIICNGCGREIDIDEESSMLVTKEVTIKYEGEIRVILNVTEETSDADLVDEAREVIHKMEDKDFYQKLDPQEVDNEIRNLEGGFEK